MSQSATLIRGTKRNLDGTAIYQSYDSSTKYLAYTIQRPNEQLVSMASHLYTYIQEFIISIDTVEKEKKCI
jgi:hypothetical protein